MSSYMKAFLIQWHSVTIFLLFSIGQTGSILSACSKVDGIDIICSSFALCTDAVLCFPCNAPHQQFSLGQDLSGTCPFVFFAFYKNFSHKLFFLSHIFCSGLLHKLSFGHLAFCSGLPHKPSFEHLAFCLGLPQ